MYAVNTEGGVSMALALMDFMDLQMLPVAVLHTLSVEDVFVRAQSSDNGYFGVDTHNYTRLSLTQFKTGRRLTFSSQQQ